MSDSSHIALLNQVLTIEFRSLARYLGDAAPWRTQGDEKVVAAVQNISLDQEDSSRRLVALIEDRQGFIDLAEYPMEFTDLHFLSMEFLLGLLIEHQKQDIADIEFLIPKFSGDRSARELIEEILGSERAHLEALEGLAAQPV